jgi:predicted nucleic acid-binding protein
MTLIVDTSVVVRWFVHQEPGGQEAADWLRRLAAEPDLLVAPDVLRLEVYGALARLQVGEGTDWAGARLDRFVRLGLRILPTTSDLMRRGFALCRELSVAGYDALYLAHAESLGTAWLTADARVLRRLPHDRRVRALVPP